MTRWDETWHRLREWTNGQGPSERLAAQVLLHEGYRQVDPSHPLGGPDGGRDAVAMRNGERWIMAVYFPRGQQGFRDIEGKFLNDLKGLGKNAAVGIAFVTNQELTLGERSQLTQQAEPSRVELFHLERIATILDLPEMAGTRQQFLGIPATVSAVAPQISGNMVLDGSIIVSSNQLGGQIAHQIINHGTPPRRLTLAALAAIAIELKGFPPESYRLHRTLGDSEGGAVPSA